MNTDLARIASQVQIETPKNDQDPADAESLRLISMNWPQRRCCPDGLDPSSLSTGVTAEVAAL